LTRAKLAVAIVDHNVGVWIFTRRRQTGASCGSGCDHFNEAKVVAARLAPLLFNRPTARKATAFQHCALDVRHSARPGWGAQYFRFGGEFAKQKRYNAGDCENFATV
jgi:hypothetical protein